MLTDGFFTAFPVAAAPEELPAAAISTSAATTTYVRLLRTLMTLPLSFGHLVVSYDLRSAFFRTRDHRTGL
jgi:hypothetical protein